MERKLEQEKVGSITQMEDLEKEILLEQNKRPEVRRKLEGYEREINTQSDKEKHGNEVLIGEYKEWTQIRLAIDYLNDFVSKFDQLSGEEAKAGKTSLKFQEEQKPAEKKGDKAIRQAEEVAELEARVKKLKTIRKQTIYWKRVYGDDVPSFNPNSLYDKLKDKRRGTITQQGVLSPKKKAEVTVTTAGKENTIQTDASRMITKQSQ